MQPFVPQLDAETFLLWEGKQLERFELHHGFVFAFAGGSLDHGRITANLVAAFDRLFPPPCRAYGSDVKVRAAADAFYYPDASLTCANVPGDATYLEQPRVIAEVLSPSTRRFDLVEKRAAYRAVASLSYYLVVHGEERLVEVDRRAEDGRWLTERYDVGTFPFGSGVLSIDEIYAKTALASER